MDAIAELPKRTHGCPADRGSADAYYGRSFNPHFWKDGQRVTKEQMTPEQIEEYRLGFVNEDDRKVYD